MSGSLTISISGIPLRFRSMPVVSEELAKPSCRLLPASSSRCRRVMPIFFVPPRSLDFNEAVLGQRLVVLRNLVALGQVGIEVILAGKDRSLVDAAVQRHGREHRELHRFAVQHGQGSRQSQAHGTNVGVGRIAEMSRAGAENLGRGQELDVYLQPDHRLILRCRGYGDVQAWQP